MDSQVSTGNAVCLIATTNWLIRDPVPTLVIGTAFLIVAALIVVSGTRRFVRNSQLLVTIIVFMGLFVPTMVAISMAFYPLMASARFASGANNSYWSILHNQKRRDMGQPAHL
jgi:hypothetical protein